MFANRASKSSRERNKEAIERYKRDEREERVRLSSACFRFIRENGFAANYHTWKAKEKGAAPGVILLGQAKSGARKKVFVKEYDEIFRACYQNEDLLDFAAFSIMKKYGGRVPKVKLKGTADDKVFSFSTDVAHEKARHPKRKYRFFEFSDDELNVSSWAGVSVKRRIFDKNLDFNIDKISVARMLMLGMILNLWDLHEENAGIVLSTEGNAKLTFIDFLIFVEDIKNEQHLDLDGLIRAYYANMILDIKINSLISVINISDYIEAFKKIDINFHSSCKDALEEIRRLSFVAEERKSHMIDVFKTWEQNYLLMQKMVMSAKNESSLFARLK